MRAIEEQITLQGNQAKLHKANMKVVLSRVGLLEKENEILASELRSIKAILCQSTSIRVRMSLLEQLALRDQPNEVEPLLK